MTLIWDMSPSVLRAGGKPLAYSLSRSRARFLARTPLMLSLRPASEVAEGKGATYSEEKAAEVEADEVEDLTRRLGVVEPPKPSAAALSNSSSSSSSLIISNTPSNSSGSWRGLLGCLSTCLAFFHCGGGQKREGRFNRHGTEKGYPPPSPPTLSLPPPSWSPPYSASPISYTSPQAHRRGSSSTLDRNGADPLGN